MTHVEPTGRLTPPTLTRGWPAARPERATCRDVVGGVRRAHQAAGHRAAAADHGAGDVLRRAGRPAARPGRRHRRRRHAVRRLGVDALNCVYDRDIDEQMRRTRRRALPRHIVSPRAALVFGARARRGVDAWSCSALGQLAVGARSRWPPTCSTSSSTRWCSSAGPPRTSSGAALAGCFPALIGWTAVTGSLAWAPVVLFLGRLLLDPAAHLGAGAALPRGLRRRRRADAAGRRAGARSAARSSLYTWVMVATSLLLWPVADDRLVLPGRRRRARRGVPRRGAPAVAPDRAAPRTLVADPADAAVPLLEPLPRRCSSSPSRSTRCITALTPSARP